ncbi:MAG TPA: hypothetical protein V6C90_04550 [Coleofasciculaceae cyanobacterium]
MTQHRLKPGWYYSVEIDADDAWYALAPIVCVEESDIWLINSVTTAPARR